MSSMDGKFHLSLSKKIPIIAELCFQDQMGFLTSPQPLAPMSHGLSFPYMFMVWLLLMTFTLMCEFLGPSYLVFFSVCCCTTFLTAVNTTVSISFWPISWEEFKAHFLLILRPRPLAITSFCSLNMFFQLCANLVHPERVCSHFNIKLKVKVFFPHV